MMSRKNPTYEELIEIRKSLEERLARIEQGDTAESGQGDRLDRSTLFGELFSRAADMIIIAETDPAGRPGKIRLANPAALERLEYSMDELRNLKLEDLLEGSAPAVRDDILHPDTLKFERAIYTKTGRKIYSDVYSHVFMHGQERFAFAIIRDMTVRREMEESLRLSEEKYKRLVESLSDEYIFYAHDPAGMITYVSPSITRVLGYSPAEAMRNYKEFYTDAGINEHALQIQEESLKGNIQSPFINELYHRDGSVRLFNNTEVPIFNEEGEVTGVEGIAQDVTDRIEAEKELRKQQDIFRLLEETIQEVFWIHDLKSDTLLYVSPKYREVYGRSTNSLYHNPGSFLKAIHPDDIGFVKKEYKKIEKGKGIDLEYRIVLPGGETRNIWSRSFVIMDERKKASLSIGTALDITSRKTSQKEKNLLAAIVENLEDHAVIKDTDLRIIASNPANTRGAGLKSAEQLIGKTDLELYGDFEHVRQYIDDDLKALKLKKGETLVNDQVFIYPDGRKIHSLVKKFPVYDEKNKLIAVASLSRDVSDYKNTLKELFESEEKYRLLINNQGEGIGMVDPKDRFLFANPKAEEIFGVAEGKLEGKSLFDFLGKKEKEFIKEQTEKRKSGEKGTYEVWIKQVGGRRKLLLVTATPQYKEGEFQGTFAVFRDITEWRTTEESLRKSQEELLEANAAKDKFFSLIAHDLKNPFHSILGFSELLIKDYTNYDKEEILTFIKMINEASRQAHSLLENLLNWSRAQTGRIRIEPEGIDLKKTFETIFKLFEPSAREKNLLMQNQVRAGTLAYGDGNMISTVFRNLVSNAIKFTKPRGRVTVSSKQLRNHVEITVADTGIGIPEEMTEKLFRIEENVTRTGTANEEGTGLGLVLCREFLEKNNGTIKVNSKVGKGSSFIVRLPKQK